MTAPAIRWLYAQAPHPCEGPCGQEIQTGERMAWQPDGDDGRLLCWDDGSDVVATILAVAAVEDEMEEMECRIIP